MPRRTVPQRRTRQRHETASMRPGRNAPENAAPGNTDRMIVGLLQ